ncbi:unnamed protein product, partial [Ilex paraguariensis]
MKAQAFIQPARHPVGSPHLQLGPLRPLRPSPVQQAAHQRTAQPPPAHCRCDDDVIQAHAAALQHGQAEPGHLAPDAQRGKGGGPGNGLQHVVMRLPVPGRHGAGLGKALQPGRTGPGIHGEGPAFFARRLRHVRQGCAHHERRIGQQVAGLRQLGIGLGAGQGREAEDGRQALALVEGFDLRQQGAKAGAGLMGIGRVGPLGMALRGAQQPVSAEHGALGRPGVEAALLHADHRLGIAVHGCAVMSERLGHARLYHGRPPCPPIIWRAAALAAGTLFPLLRSPPLAGLLHDHRHLPSSPTHLAVPWRRLRLQDRAGPAGGADRQERAAKQFFPDLLVGTETADDAAVYRINDEQAIVATTDFFMPIVDDPYDFGRIAATNALSDIYAMGGQPLMALAIVGMPINVLPHDTIAKILEGGESVCRDAGIPLAGGHSIDSVEPIYGLVGIGIVNPRQMKRNADAKAGDVLILGKPLGPATAPWWRQPPCSTARHGAGQDGRRARADRCDGLRPAGPWPGAGTRRGPDGAHRQPQPARAAHGAGLCRAGRHHGRLGPQLGLVWHAGGAGRRHHRCPARAADRSADLGRPARIVHARCGGPGACAVCRTGLWRCSHRRPHGSGPGPRRGGLSQATSQAERGPGPPFALHAGCSPFRRALHHAGQRMSLAHGLRLVGRAGLDGAVGERQLEPLARTVGLGVVRIVGRGRIVRQREGQEGMGLHSGRREAHHLHVAVAVRLPVHAVAALLYLVFRAGDGEVAHLAASAIQRRLLSATLREQHGATRRIHGKAAGLHGLHCFGERLLQRRLGRGLDAARRVDGVGRIEGHGIQVGRFDLAGHALPELVPDMGAPGCRRARAVPGLQRRAGSRYVHRFTRRGHGAWTDLGQCIVLETRAVHTAVQHHLANDVAGGHLARIAVRARQPLQRHGVAQARAQALGRRGGAEDGRIAGQRCRGIGQPSPRSSWACVRADGAGLHRIRIRAPVALAAAAGQHRHLGQRRVDGCRGRRGAGLQLRGRHVGHGAYVGIPDLGVAASRSDGVDPGNGRLLLLDADELVQRLGLVPAQPVAESAVVVGVDVADGEHALRGPA